MPSPRFERGTPGLGILCSIHLSYEGVKRFAAPRATGTRSLLLLRPIRQAIDNFVCRPSAARVAPVRSKAVLCKFQMAFRSRQLSGLFGNPIPEFLQIS